MLDVRASAREGPVAQRLEQGTHNSRETFCAVFRGVAQRVFQSRPEASWFALRCAELRSFAAKFYQTVERTVKSESFARAWNCSSLDGTPFRARYALRTGQR